MIGIVNKPQFDKDVFTVGKAIHIKKYGYNRFAQIDANALVIDCQPLELTVAFVEKKQGIQEERIKISEISESTYEITELKEER